MFREKDIDKEKRYRERERETERERDRKRQIERPTDRQTSLHSMKTTCVVTEEEW